ncbi:MAG: hypothetical protein GC154_18470 [bacterium]|nr:hypothetical protein [bacterium]
MTRRSDSFLPDGPASAIAAGALLCAALSAAACGWAAAYSSRAGYWAAFIFWILFFVLTALASRRWLASLLIRAREANWLPLAGLIVLSLGTSLYRLSAIPYSVHGDEGMVGLAARRLLHGGAETFFSSSWYFLPQFFFSIPAMSMALFGDSLFGLRLSAAVTGALSVVPVYLLARRWWSEWPALAACVLMVSNPWFQFLSRFGGQYVQAAFFTVWLLWLWEENRERPSMAARAWAGAWMGLAMQSYQACHLLPLLWIASALGLAAARRNAYELAANVLIPLVFMIACLGPLMAHDWMKNGKMEFLFSRADSVSLFSQSGWNRMKDEYGAERGAAAILMNQAERAWLAPLAFLDRSGQYGARTPMLGWLAGVPFVLGAAAALTRGRGARGLAAFLWLAAILTAGGALTIDDPFYPRLAGGAGLLFLTIAGGFAALERFSGARIRAARWLIAAMTLAATVMQLHAFFYGYARRDAPLMVHYPQTRLAYWIAAQPAGTSVFVIAGPHGSFQSGTVRFLAPDARGRDVASAAEIPMPPGPAAAIVDPTRKSELPALLDRFPDAKVDLHRNPRGDLLFYSVELK